MAAKSMPTGAVPVAGETHNMASTRAIRISGTDSLEIHSYLKRMWLVGATTAAEER